MNDGRYMNRALQLALNGCLHASPNPMVGAVIVAPDGRIIGEGWHRRCGSAHAEVNAVTSVASSDRYLLTRSSMYVTLEPCSHFGKTPPCAEMIIETGIPRVVVATCDPFPKVAGRGITMMRDAGVQVEVGLMADEAQMLNRRFFAAHTRRRPWVTLKWAMTCDGFIDARRLPDDPPLAISTPLSRLAVHRLRAMNDAVMIGSGTYLADTPSLTVRDYAGDSPMRFVADRSGSVSVGWGWNVVGHADIPELTTALYNDFGVTSLLVEGGACLLGAFIRSGLWDEARVEVAPVAAPTGAELCVAAPQITGATLRLSDKIDGNEIFYYANNQ